VDYYSVTDYVGLAVAPAPLSVTANNASRPYGVENPAFTGVLAGVQNGDNITASYDCAARCASPAGVYPIIPDLADPGGRLPNYQVSVVDGAMTVLAAVPPVFQLAALSANTLSFSWTATPGVAYQVQWNWSLAPGTWFNLGGLIVATNSMLLPGHPGAAIAGGTGPFMPAKGLWRHRNVGYDPLCQPPRLPGRSIPCCGELTMRI
jgi:hypothetical protein